jgi:putative redox protein
MTRTRKAEIVRVGALFDAVLNSGATARFGEPADGGLSPMDTILAALASCTAMDVHTIVTKQRQRVDRYAVRAIAEQRDEHPRIYTRIDVTHDLEGEGLSVDAIRRAIELSAAKYCPVNAMLSAGTTEIHHHYAVRSSGPEPTVASGEVLVTGHGGPAGMLAGG